FQVYCHASQIVGHRHTLGIVKSLDGTVCGFHGADNGQSQRCEVPVAFGIDDAGGHADMVTAVVEDRDPLDDHPVGQGGDVGQAVGTCFHGDVGEFVGILA